MTIKELPNDNVYEPVTPLSREEMIKWHYRVDSQKNRLVMSARRAQDKRKSGLKPKKP